MNQGLPEDVIMTDQQPVAPGGDDDANTSDVDDQPAKDVQGMPVSQVVSAMTAMSRFATNSSVLQAAVGASKFAAVSPGLHTALGTATGLSKFAAGGSALEAVMGTSKFAVGSSSVLKAGTCFSQFVTSNAGLQAAPGVGAWKLASDSAGLKAAQAVLGVSRFDAGGSDLHAALGVATGFSKLAAGGGSVLEAAAGSSKFASAGSALEAVVGVSKFVSGRSGLDTALGAGAWKLASDSAGLKAAQAVLGVSRFDAGGSDLHAALGVATGFSKLAAGGGSVLEAVMGVSAFGADSPAFKTALAVTQGNLAGSLRELAGVASAPGSRRLIDVASSLLREIEDEGGRQLVSAEPRGTISKALAYKIVIFVALLELCFVLMMATPVHYKAIVDLLGPSLGILGVVSFFQQKRDR